MALVTVQLKCYNSNEIFRELSIFQLNVFNTFYWISKITRSMNTASKSTNRTNSGNGIFEKITVAMD